jgi:hypothetical protein
MAKQPGYLWRGVTIICTLGGILLVVIGIRYLLVPHSAARTFGVPAHPAGFELHHIIGLRNIWLGALAIGCIALQQWRALALWFAIGTVVCFADAVIAASSIGRLPQVAFHIACGFGCIGLAVAVWRRAKLDP